MSDDETTYSAIKTVLGGTRRDQRWHLTDEVDVLTVLGSSRFDLRSVETPGNDVVEISITCVLGVVDLLVPAGTMVVLDGTSFLASARSAVSDGDDASLPRLEVTATTILGRVRVRSPRPDEHPASAAEQPVSEIGIARVEADEPPADPGDVSEEAVSADAPAAASAPEVSEVTEEVEETVAADEVSPVDEPVEADATAVADVA